MGYNIFIRSILRDELITVDGDGSDSRSNTFIHDCVQGIMLAFERRSESVGQTFNIGGGEEVTVNQVLNMLEQLTGKDCTSNPWPSSPRRPEAHRRRHQ